MSNFEDLVPPLELCKLIPAGEFNNSFFVWGYSCDKRNKEPFVDYRDDIEYLRRNMVNAPDLYPAPTLQEIMVELCNFTPYCIKVCESFKQWHIECCIAQEYRERYISADSAKNPATAALKLWIKLKGVEHGE